MRTIQLTPSQNSIKRNYLRGEEVFCVCDTTLASFTVTMPDCEGVEDVIFNFINVGTNLLTISCLTRQNISGQSYFTLKQWDTARLIIDSAVSRYLIVGKKTNRFGSETDYTEFGTDGTLTMNGNATVWSDIDFNIVVKTTGVGLPAYNTLQGNIKMLQWAINDAQDVEAQELYHKFKERSTLYWHVHFITGGTDITDRGVRYEVEFTGANVNGTLLANSIQSGEVTIPANTPALTHFVIPVYAWENVFDIAAHIKVRVKRIASTTVATAPTANPFCEMVQLHAECDTLGSKEITTK